ncbi:hypothetical protein PAXINDRAFT_16398 [Paxillus involutus ATCC 200175]|uniref:Uncharacterized protein n=1 Tax=Paxillus involutus ATCC 200175 TaxID=664439 RepID=A0A0C9T4N9_PAXIN|nr:hypothetical protein PAXINDRAFT_16398 [Paxillus involutus ATCC 200175]
MDPAAATSASAPKFKVGGGSHRVGGVQDGLQLGRPGGTHHGKFDAHDARAL